MPSPIDSADGRERASARPREPFLDVVGALLFLRRNIWVVLAAVALFVGLGLVYRAVTPDTFLSTAQVYIDTRKTLFNSQGASTDPAIDAATVESQVELLTSDNTLRRTVQRLNLSATLGTPQPGALTRLREMAGLAPSGEPTIAPDRVALETLGRNVRARRIGATYIINVSYTGTDPVQAAAVANAIIEEYIAGQLQARYDAASQASVWVRRQLEELRAQAANASSATQEFRARNKADLDLAPVLEQRVAEANQRLGAAAARSEEARTRLAEAEALLRGERAGSDRLNPALRDQLLRARQEGGTAPPGADAEAVLARLRSDAQAATSQEEGLRRSLDDLLRENARVQGILVNLRELEGVAQNYRSLYDNFQQRSSEAILTGTFPVAEARVVSPALPPLRKSNPGTLLVVLVGGIVGSMVGLGTAIALHLLRGLSRASRTLGPLTSPRPAQG